MADVLSVRGLSRRYGEVVALQGIDLTLGAGELRGLLGPNGAGKTTLMRSIFGLVHPDAGEISFVDRPAGFVEDPTFYPYLSGEANLRIVAELEGADPAGARAALERVGLGRRGRDRVGGYSTGMRQRLGVAAALLRAPKVLLFDEPTSGMDPESARTTAALLRGLAVDGVGVLISSHQIGELEALCSSYTILRDGQVVWTGSAAEVEASDPASAYRLVSDDDDAALAVVERDGSLASALSRDGSLVSGLRLTGSAAVRDACVRALAGAGIVVRRLEPIESALANIYRAMTS